MASADVARFDADGSPPGADRPLAENQRPGDGCVHLGLMGFKEGWEELIPELCSVDRFKAAEVVRRMVDTSRFRGRREHPPRYGRFIEKVIFGPTDCWYWIGNRIRSGYGMFKDGGKNKVAHRVSWELHRGLIPAGMDVLHKCDVRCCVNPDHLFLGTALDNARDMIAKGRHRFVGPPRGEKNPRTKLSDAQVDEMRAVREERGLSYKALAAMFGVTAMTAHRAITTRGTSASV